MILLTHLELIAIPETHVIVGLLVGFKKVPVPAQGERRPSPQKILKPEDAGD